MSAKPTPGPCTVEEAFESYVVRSPNRTTIAIFTADNGMKIDEAEANARAWIGGMAALDTLAKIRAVEHEWGESRMSAGQCVVAISKILDEAKP